MKQNISIFLSIVAIVLSVYTISQLVQSKDDSSPRKIFKDDDDEKENEIEIADLMEYIQTFHNKVYAAAKAGNNKLANFYLHEMGEKMNEISKANIWSNGVNVSDNIRTYGLKAIDALIDKDAKFIFQNFENLTTACNSCHVASKHDEIVIKTPEQVDFPNQVFAPAK